MNRERTPPAMMAADRLTVHMHDDTTRTLPAGTSYELSRAGVRYVTPDGTEGQYEAWEVLRVDADHDRQPDDAPTQETQ